ncbi:MAG: hypothetical protein UY42_C0025G0004 [Parcubacteria group bacterium GW2011_GWA2_49_16]|nr:MAG: hypothetical protein UY42_C0025G0004 [Parcubacteria group bacterium GW2011_GWA2_49_16]HLA49264.1 hypothetical protein [Candidatus Saccharimonadales bacterium]
MAEIPKTSTGDPSTLLANAYPDLAAIREGQQVSPQIASLWGEAFNRKIITLSRKEQLNAEEVNFIDSVVDLGSRNVHFLLERYDFSLPEDTDQKFAMVTRRLFIAASTIRENAASKGAPLPETDWPASSTVLKDKWAYARLMNFMTATAGLLYRHAHRDLRSPMEDYAANIVLLPGVLAEHSGPITIDPYLAGNFGVLAAKYGIIEAQPGVE